MMNINFNEPELDNTVPLYDIIIQQYTMQAYGKDDSAIVRIFYDLIKNEYPQQAILSFWT